MVRHAERGKGREPVARALQRGNPPVRAERGAAQHEVPVQHVDGEHLLDLHVFNPSHLRKSMSLARNRRKACAVHYTDA
jgi:hypothetical protein